MLQQLKITHKDYLLKVLQTVEIFMCLFSFYHQILGQGEDIWKQIVSPICQLGACWDKGKILAARAGWPGDP